MTEGTEDAETQEPSIYKDFGQKVRLVRSQESKTCSTVLKEIIRTAKTLKFKVLGSFHI